MRRRWKWLTAGLALALALPLLVVLVIDEEDVRRLISDTVSSRTGRALEIGGELTVSAGLRPRVLVEDIRLANPSWASRPWALEIDRATLELDLWSVFRGELLIEGIALESPRLWVEKNADGIHNFRFRPPDAPEPPPMEFPPWINLTTADITGGRISVIKPARTWVIEVDRATGSTAASDRPVQAQAEGRIEGMPVEATASLSSLADMFARRPADFTVAGFIGDATNQVSFDGTVENLFRWRGVSGAIGVKLTDIPALSGFPRKPLPDLGRLEGTMLFSQPGKVESMRLEGIDLEGDWNGITSRVSGEIARLVRLEAFAVRIELGGALSDPALDALDGLGGEASLGGALTLGGALKEIELGFDGVNAASEAWQLQADGRLVRDGPDWLGKVPVELVMDDFTWFSDLTGRKFPDTGPLTMNAALVRDTAGWGLSDMALQFEQEGLVMMAKGQLEGLPGQSTGSVSIDVSMADERFLLPLFKGRFPPSSDLRLEGSLELGEGELSAVIHEVSGRMAGADLSATGIIADLPGWQGVDLAARARVDRLADLAPFRDRNLPHEEPLVASGKIVTGADGGLDLVEIEASMDDPNLDLEAVGSIRNLGPALQADVLFDGSINAAEFLETWRQAGAGDGSSLQAFVPVLASGALRSEGWERWSVAGLQASRKGEGLRLSVSGELAPLNPFAVDLDVNLHAERFDVLPLPPALDWLGHGQLDLDFRLNGEPGAMLAEDLVGRVKTDAATLHLKGSLDDAWPPQVDVVDIEIELDSLAALGDRQPGALRSDNAATGSLRLSRDSTGHHGRLDLVVGKSDVRGTLEWPASSAGVASPPFAASLSSDRLDLRDLLAEPPDEGRLFSESPVSVAWTGDATGSISLKARSIGNRLLDVTDANVGITLAPGRMGYVLEGHMGTGRINLVVNLDEREAPLAMELYARGRELDSDGLRTLNEAGFIESGLFDLDVAIAARGDTMAALAGKSNGKVYFRLDDARLQSQAINFIGGDLFTNVVTLVNPFDKVGQDVNVECGVLLFDIEDGIASRKEAFAAKTEHVTLLGGGELDLGDESVKFLISPKARKGLGINTSTVARMIRIGGTLDSPEFETDASGLLQSGAAFWAALTTGGLSLLGQGLIDRVQANADVCELIAAPPSTPEPVLGADSPESEK